MQDELSVEGFPAILISISVNWIKAALGTYTHMYATFVTSSSTLSVWVIELSNAS